MEKENQEMYNWVNEFISHSNFFEKLKEKRYLDRFNFLDMYVSDGFVG